MKKKTNVLFHKVLSCYRFILDQQRPENSLSESVSSSSVEPKLKGKLINLKHIFQYDEKVCFSADSAV